MIDASDPEAKEKAKTPANMSTTTKHRSSVLEGFTSPYPTVVNVCVTK